MTKQKEIKNSNKKNLGKREHNKENIKIKKINNKIQEWTQYNIKEKQG